MIAHLASGDTFAGYRIEEPAGAGGTGVVHRARQLTLDRPVALEVLGADADPALRERFARESRVLGSIEHPSLVPVYEAGVQDGQAFVARRWVEGTDLAALLAGGELDRQQAARIVERAGEGLDAAHARGLVHGDVRAQNVLVEGDHVYLANFAGGPGEPTDDVQALHAMRRDALEAAVEPTRPERPVAPARGRRPLLIAFAAVGVVAVAAAVVLIARGGDEQPARSARAPATGPLKAGEAKVDHISLGSHVAPGELAGDARGILVVDRNAVRILFVDPAGGEVTRRLKANGVYDLKPDPYVPDRMWASFPLLHTIRQIDTRSGRFTGRAFRVKGTPSLLGVARNQLVVTGDPAKHIVLKRLDKRTGRQIGPTVQESHSSGTDLVLADGINVVHWIAAAVLTFDDQLGAMRFIDFKIPGVNSILGPMGTEMAMGRGGIAWVLVNYASPNRIAVVRANLRTKKQIGKMIELGSGSARDIAVDRGIVWVPNMKAGTVMRIDERSGRILGSPIRVGDIQGEIAAFDGKAYVAGARDLVRITP